MRQGGGGRTRARADVAASVMWPRLLLVVCTVILVMIGLVMVFSASSITAISEGQEPYADFARQAAYALAGAVGCVLIARLVPYRVWRGPLTVGVFAACVLLLLLTWLIGTSELGAQRWLTLGPLNLQPSEVAKVGVMLMMAKLLVDYQDGGMEARTFLYLFLGMNAIIVVLVLYAESDLGTTLICVMGILALMWLGEVRLRYVVYYLLGVAVAGAASLGVGYRWQRVLSFLDPWSDYYGTGYQLIHSYYAFAQGGLTGVGVGHSAEKYLYLPEAHTDFIFAVIGEEWGLVGAVAVIAVFLLFLWAGLNMARNAPDRFGALLCGSFSVIIVFQAFLNMACAIGLMPVTGKPLPFISSGGTSLIVSLLMVGFMLSVSHAWDEPPEYRRRREALSVVGGGYDGYGGYGGPSRRDGARYR